MIKIELETTDTGCVVCTSHKLNSDGYFRKRVDGKLQMYHRWVWEQEHGEIPEGFEVDHKCRNRACCNINHLQILDRTTHLIKTNKQRYADRLEEAREYWRQTNCTGFELGQKFGVSDSCGYRWIRIWKKQ